MMKQMHPIDTWIKAKHLEGRASMLGKLTNCEIVAFRFAFEVLPMPRWKALTKQTDKAHSRLHTGTCAVFPHSCWTMNQ